MPTFDDPRKDAAEAFEALRGLAHASRSFADPADTYAVTGDLLGGVRSLRQVVDQLAAAHIAHRGRAYDDAGSQAAGATSAFAAADELHQAGTLLDAVEERLNAASQHSGRIASHPATERESIGAAGPERTVTQAGALTLTVWPDTPLGEHQRHGYRVEDTTTGEAVEGRDLFTGAGAPVTPDQAVRELAVFLSAAGEARQYALDNPGTNPENEGLFPERIADAARLNADALNELVEHGPNRAARDEAPEAELRWISVVFLQGEEADKVLTLIDRDGTDAAIEHLAGFDYGEETMRAALENGYIYASPPAGTLDRTATRDDYTLVHNPFNGYVSLYREFIATPELAPEPTEVHPLVTALIERHAQRRDTPTPQRPVRPDVRGQAAAADWFARPPASSAHGRGRVL
ncbi:hypothetical protein SAMN05443377_11920 [Propionibacterium cyclohexanicum]|uniref:Uncharacterized protein n=1 Tax=Propionibacterium cyclohexanicum TaxID=64702 RepID=A0A1H9T682_9ACTN|nr:hypothetical protein [Propionibacterium cyclohexanicum]SER92722.1 hypothetical protein SAMN05443377_11920 [Propionibacterium cyclohexanicum]